jgi:hypothetical protein
VIYTGDVKSAPDTLDLDGLRVKVRQVFLKGYDGNRIYADTKAKVEAGAPLTDEETIHFIVSPLTKIGKPRQQFIEDCIGLAQKIPDEETQLFIIGALAVAVDKFVDQAYIKRIKEWLKMTKLEKLYEEERIEAVNKAVSQATKEKEKEKKDIIRNMLLENLNIQLIMKITNAAKKDIEDIQQELYSCSIGISTAICGRTEETSITDSRLW